MNFGGLFTMIPCMKHSFFLFVGAVNDSLSRQVN